jgi:hypothetical protein
MQWLFELSAACALTALALTPLVKLVCNPATHSRAIKPRLTRFQGRILLRVRADTPQARP